MSEVSDFDWLEFEKAAYSRGFTSVCGVDEAGRGPLAGPVCAAAVILPEGLIIEGVNDSKKPSEKKREILFDVVREQALSYSIAFATVEEIEEINILNATMLAMKRAVEGLSVPADYAMIDGNCVSISGVSKRFNSQEDAFNFYGREIRWNPETHNHIVEITKWAAENTRMINCVFSSYIIDHRWEFIESMRNGEQGNVNFDTIRML